MTKHLCAFALSAGLVVSGSALADTVFVGGNPSFGEFQTKIDGRAFTVVKMAGFYHEMNLPPNSAQPIGLEEFFFVVKSVPKWNDDRCEKWIGKVHADEGAWTTDSATYPYWEIDIAANAKPLTVDGLRAYWDKDVSCWETMDFGPPLY